MKIVNITTIESEELFYTQACFQHINNTDPIIRSKMFHKYHKIPCLFLYGLSIRYDIIRPL